MSDREHAQRRIVACWNIASKDYDAHAGHGLRFEAERQAWLTMLRDVLPHQPSDVLDVGTGTGFMAFRAHELGHRVTGIDLSHEMLAVAQRRAADLGAGGRAPTFAIGDALAPDFPPSSFDVITNRHLLWTLVDPEAALRRWHELLRPGGRLVIIDGIWKHDDEKKDEDATQEEQDSHNGEEFYTEDVLAALPLTHAESIAEIITIVESAGFRAVRTIDLAQIDDAEGHLESSEGRYGLLAGR